MLHTTRHAANNAMAPKRAGGNGGTPEGIQITSNGAALPPLAMMHDIDASNTHATTSTPPTANWNSGFRS